MTIKIINTHKTTTTTIKQKQNNSNKPNDEIKRRRKKKPSNKNESKQAYPIHSFQITLKIPDSKTPSLNKV